MKRRPGPAESHLIPRPSADVRPAAGHFHQPHELNLQPPCCVSLAFSSAGLYFPVQVQVEALHGSLQQTPAMPLPYFNSLNLPTQHQVLQSPASAVNGVALISLKIQKFVTPTVSTFPKRAHF